LIRGFFLGVGLLALITAYTRQGWSLLGSRVEPTQQPLSIENVEKTIAGDGIFLNVTVHNQELYPMVAVVDCESDEEDDFSPCAATTTPLISPGGRAIVRLLMTRAPDTGAAVTVRVRESLEYVVPSDTEFSRLFPAHRLRVDVR
jgi:hypothetical protein